MILGSIGCRWIRWIVIGIIAVNIQSLIARGTKGTAGHVRGRGPLPSVVISNENKVGCAVVLKWGIEGDVCPSVGRHGNTATEHFIGLRDRHPIGIAGK